MKVPLQKLVEPLHKVVAPLEKVVAPFKNVIATLEKVEGHFLYSQTIFVLFAKIYNSLPHRPPSPLKYLIFSLMIILSNLIS